MNPSPKIQLGLRENAGLFATLVLMSAFVGAMVGFERSLLPELTRAWGIGELEASLIMVGIFGLSKALANLTTGHLIARTSRKQTLLLGWIIALLTPLTLWYSASSAWIILANVALGISQGWTWSATVIMKIDLVGPKKRGTAMGLNESAGYLAVGTASALGAWYFERSGAVNPILYTALILALLALLITAFALPDTRPWVDLERELHPPIANHEEKGIFYRTTYGDKNLRNITWAGVANNANDGILWAVLPSVLLASGVSLKTVGLLTGIHAATWGLGQLFTGPLSNRGNIARLITSGMLLQAAGLVGLYFTPASVLPYVAIGLGTALVYPTFLVGISNYSHPSWRPRALSTYRFWRDMGYVMGAGLGFAAVRFGDASWAFLGIAAVTAFAGLVFVRARRIS